MGKSNDSANAFVVENVARSFGQTRVFENLSLTVNAGEFVALVGPSGCGKTTLLSLLSGFDQPNSGSVRRPARIRTVYQQSGLLPWRTVGENIVFGLRDLPLGESEKTRKTGDLLALVGLSDFQNHYPHQISGGMRQRAELARALAGNADALLLDEPFSALDYLTRLSMRRELAHLLNTNANTKTTVVLVTHDIEEAAQLADRILVLTQRPARIGAEFDLSHLPPRPRTTAQVLSVVQNVLETMGFSPAVAEQSG